MLGLNHNTTLLIYASVAVLGLIVSVGWLKLNSFVALALASLFVGLCSEMKLPEIARHFQEGVGSVLGSIAMVIGLGAILGKMLAESGGAESIAEALGRALGERRLHWTMMLLGLIVGLPVFFAVGLVLLVPVLFAVVQEKQRPLLSLGIPMLAGLAVAHSLVPPHPGPMAAIGILNADTGRTIFYSLLVALPTAILIGPILGRKLGRGVRAEPSGLLKAFAQKPVRDRLPPFGLTLLTILLPILLMLAGTLADLTLERASRPRSWLDLIGSPLVAMLLALLFSFYTFGASCGLHRAQILKCSEECLAPVGAILLVVGAGGGFGRVLVGSGVADAISALAANWNISPLLLGWTVAALIRVAVGSATVAITTASGIIAPVVARLPGTNLELLVLAMGAGSSFFSHVNDGGFWFVKEYFNLTVPQTLRTWSVMVTLQSIIALILVMILNALV
jgi:gluconate:H+ symporter, GntP family